MLNTYLEDKSDNRVMSEPTMEPLKEVGEPVLPVNGAETTKHNEVFKKRKVFNDPIHGQIELHPVCCRIIDTPQFQRLRHIKQLDTCYLVYPGASHNRFEHSIGVCYLAGKLLKIIRERQPDEEISDKDILCVEIAGLCHDLGQGPFSHVFEKRFMPKMKSKSHETFTHENLARKMFKFMLETEEEKLKEDIKQILEICGMQNLDDEDYVFISEMIDVPEDIEQVKWPYKGRKEFRSYMYEIVKNKRNGIDVDKWDYLARDSYMLGMKVNVDYNRCFMSARVIKCNGVQGRNNTSLPLRKQICYREKEAQDLYDMFYTRMTLHRRAYQHKTHKVIGMMMCAALESADKHFFIKGKRISETVDNMEAYTYLTDDIIQLIINDNDKNLKEAQNILDDITNRRVPKCVKEIRCEDISVTEGEVIEGITKNLGSTSMQERSFYCDIVKFNYGMDNNNPMKKVRFYNKDNLDQALRIDKNQVSFILPDTFEESIIRLYCKNESQFEKKTTEKIKAAFDSWWKERESFTRQRETGDQTELKLLNENIQSEPYQRAERPDDTLSVQTVQALPEHAPLEREEPASEQLTLYSRGNIDEL